MTLKDLYQYCVEKANQYPELANEIYSFYDLAEMEVHIVGASVEHECELAISDIDELIQEYND